MAQNDRGLPDIGRKFACRNEAADNVAHKEKMAFNPVIQNKKSAKMSGALLHFTSHQL